MRKIRLAAPDDLDAFYHISLETDHLRGDASHLYFDLRMVEYMYSAPYLKYSPQLALVVEQHNLAVGNFLVAKPEKEVSKTK